uniref:RING-type domain-containing protein n=1 Tax=Ictidomys tridecemlineatus TaxID=43179 RepID=A0A287CXN5_ICTTR
MASWVFCNYCFQSPRRTSSFSLTSCGHVYCDACLGKGKKDECLICKVPCRTVLLSKHPCVSSGSVGLLSPQVSEFQEKHRKRLLAFYRAKISQLEESLRKSALQVEQLQSWRSLASRDLMHPGSLARHKACPPRRQPAAPPSSTLCLSPTGSVSYPGPPHPSLTPRQVGMAAALRVPPVQMPCKGASPAPASWRPGRAARGGSPVGGVAQARPPRPPISISGLLQRQCLGKVCSLWGIDTWTVSTSLPCTCPALLFSRPSTCAP